MKKFIINKSKWLRQARNPQGEPTKSVLLDKDGNSCCLGQCALQLGVQPETLLNVPNPFWACKDSPDERAKLMGLFLNSFDCYHWVYDCMDCNDATGSDFFTEEWVIEGLVGIMADHGIELEFID